MKRLLDGILKALDGVLKVLDRAINNKTDFPGKVYSSRYEQYKLTIPVGFFLFFIAHSPQVLASEEKAIIIDHHDRLFIALPSRQAMSIAL